MPGALSGGNITDIVRVSNPDGSSISVGGSGGSSLQDGAVFVTGTSYVNPTGWLADDAATAPTAGDIAAPRMNPTTRIIYAELRDNVGAAVSFTNTQYTEDVASTADPVGTMLMAVRKDTLAAITTTDNDNIAIRATNKGEVYVKQSDNLTVAGTGTFLVQAAQSGTWNVGTVTTVTNVVHVDDNAATLSVDDGASSLTVDYAITGSGVSTGAIRVELPTNGTGIIATVGTVTSLTQMNGVAIAMNTGVRAAGVQRVTIATDDIVPASQSGTWNVGTLSTVTNVVHVDDNAGSLTVDGTVAVSGTTAVKELRSGTGTHANVADSAVSATLIASNANRLGATIYNDSTVSLYLKLAATASATSFTTILLAQDYYEVPFGYTGIIDGIWASDASGSARVVEFTA